MRIWILIFFSFIKLVSSLQYTGNGVLALDFVAKTFPNQENQLEKRDYTYSPSGITSFPLDLQSYTYYTTTLSIGRPSISYTVAIDLDMPYTWLTYYNVMAFNPAYLGIVNSGTQWSTDELRYFLCKKESDSCYFGNASSSFHFVTSPSTFFIRYDDNITVAGINVQDSLSYSHYQALPDFQFGITLKEYVPSSMLPYKGVLGLAASTEINSIDYSDSISSFSPPTFLEQLVKEDILAYPAFSMYLDNQGNGSLLLGAVDTSKYQGQFVALKQTKLTHYAVSIYSVQFLNSTFFSNYSIITDAYFQTRETYIYLPAELAYSVMDNAGAYLSEGYFALNCDEIDLEAALIFQFGCNSTIKVPISLLVIGQVSNICLLGIRPSTDSEIVLGLLFFRNAYTFYHQSQKMIAIGQAFYNATSNLSAIVDQHIPGALTCSQYPTSVASTQLVQTSHFTSTSLSAVNISESVVYSYTSSSSMPSSAIPSFNISLISQNAVANAGNSFSPLSAMVIMMMSAVFLGLGII
ncbi:aspartic protease, yapsin family, unknown specificity Yps1 [Schizosaccharomyces pombe]|uniref:Aspartic proteinase yapsin-1 n=1 Tax=Schizosaccharomyces pombe (strain 972 / ATCC 24843) TaxID=284812 RepID=YPS1_SCHPO|nr:yapsin Yps1 [Schizosaccharomyces pombe]O59774.1 RecName: Full=Aspartic proteinase yapsin-1; Flags: Precursor [Schizosaccharomyces pombe 972h-]CAA18644.1 aspartic protease, yapsin Yps1 [Schizosaccharomyces pombe]|eukprot:NP_588035.1 yapsin Yps1 [Schizosaccharomyces pombe]